MSDVDLRESVVSLGETVTQLRKAAEEQAENATALSVQVRESNERAARDRRVLRILTGVMVFKMVTLLLLVIVIFRLNDTNQAIKDCTTPTGECAQRGARQTGAAVLGIEAERLRTEIALAEIRGDDVSASFRKKRLAEIEEQVKAIREADKIPSQ